MRGKIHQRVVDHYRIFTLESWRLVRASDILQVNGVGKGYLSKLRLWLAHRDVCLKGDNPPSYWLTLEKRADMDEPSGPCPFTIIVDSNETFPFTFEGITDKDGKLVNVPCERKAMWTSKLADYSIKGMETEIQIERKSLEDLVGTLSGRRENFEEEIATIDGLCSYAAIVCECQWSDILADQHDHGARAKSVSRTCLSWRIKYPRVHWEMCFGRQHAERVTYQLLYNYWWQAQREESAKERGQLHADIFAPV